MISFKSYLIESPAKAVKEWSAQGVSVDEIKTRLAQFKEFKAQNLIKGEQEKDLNYWINNGSFDSFSAMLDKYVKHVTKKETIVKAGAKKVFENDKVLVIVPTTYKASAEYGSSEWCIVYGESYWDDYTYGDGLTPYYILPKNDILDNYQMEHGSPDSPLRKIAVMVNSGGNIHSVWDANDKKITLTTPYMDTSGEHDTYYDLRDILDVALDMNIEDVCDESHLKPSSAIDKEMSSILKKMFETHQVEIFFSTLDNWYKTNPQEPPAITAELVTSFVLDKGTDINQYFRDVSTSIAMMDMIKEFEKFIGRELAQVEMGILHGLYSYVVENIAGLTAQVSGEDNFEFIQ